MQGIPKPLGLIVILGLATAFAGCDTGYSRDLVQHVTSLDGQIEAVIYETNGGATTSFGYEVDLRKVGDKAGVDVAELYGPVRNEGAYGVNLKWTGPGMLHVEYLRAKSIVSSRPIATVNGQRVQVSLDSGITDPAAPGGGMLRSLRKN